jgi:hypothetical protein
VITEVKQRNKLINKNTHAHTQKPPPVLREENFAICWFSFQFEHAFEMEKKAKKRKLSPVSFIPSFLYVFCFFLSVFE